MKHRTPAQRDISNPFNHRPSDAQLKRKIQWAIVRDGKPLMTHFEPLALHQRLVNFPGATVERVA